MLSGPALVSFFFSHNDKTELSALVSYIQNKIILYENNMHLDFKKTMQIFVHI